MTDERIKAVRERVESGSTLRRIDFKELLGLLDERDKEIDRMKKHGENLRLDYLDEVERAEKADAELSSLREAISQICGTCPVRGVMCWGDKIVRIPPCPLSSTLPAPQKGE